MNDHNDKVIGLRQKGTENWGYQDANGKVSFGPLSARTLFFDPNSDRTEISSTMSKAAQSGPTTGDIEQVAVRRRLEVLEEEPVG